ncbi:hypothetical protein Poly41_25770 [Novipirellula artificiosorum]|uniref:Uncharacterized protein n=1 Tax=Novipirellula artificiosorum TaxID=2528016 RepID=A0A5C6DWD7_9BACT|nr:hypothetical protein Poly41_25770 [Novipirellula artificiosorum]
MSLWTNGYDGKQTPASGDLTKFRIERTGSLSSLSCIESPKTLRSENG